MVMSSSSASSLRRKWLPKSAPTAAVTSIHNGLGLGTLLSICPLSKGPYIFDRKLDSTLEQGSSQNLVEHSNVGEEALSCLCAQGSAEVSGFFPTTITITYPFVSEFYLDASIRPSLNRNIARAT